MFEVWIYIRENMANFTSDLRVDWWMWSVSENNHRRGIKIVKKQCYIVYGADKEILTMNEKNYTNLYPSAQLWHCLWFLMMIFPYDDKTILRHLNKITDAGRIRMTSPPPPPATLPGPPSVGLTSHSAGRNGRTFGDTRSTPTVAIHASSGALSTPC